MLSILCLSSLLLIVFYSLPEISCTYISELHSEIGFNSSLEVGTSWEFNQTISSNDEVTVNVTLQNGTLFALVEVHSFLHHVSLFDSSGNEEIGSNVGIIMFPSEDNIEFKIRNPNKIAVKIIGFITPYSEQDPVPGAETPIVGKYVPYLDIEVSKNLVRLLAQPSAESENESTNVTKYSLFFLHSTEKDFSLETYFEGIRTMVDPKRRKMEASEYKIPLCVNESGNNITALFANYPGTGIFFTLIAKRNNGSSMYVTGHTFGCDYLKDKDSCLYLASTFCRVEVIILCVAGLILCFCGYEWKSFELSIMTFLLTGIFAYTGLYELLSLEENLLASMGIGLITGSILVMIISYSKCLQLRHMIAFCAFGFLVAATILFFSEAGNSAAFRYEEVYWATFFAIVATSFIVQYINRNLSHYFTTSLIGSFMAVLTLDYFAGSSLKFIVLDNIRRLSVEDFTYAYMNPPFQTPEVVLSVLWFTFAMSSLAYQYFGRILCCEHEEETQVELISDTYSDHNDCENDMRTEFRYATFDDALPLIDPDPYQRWLLSSRD